LAESRIRHSAKSLPSARQKTLGKEAFADHFFAVSSLPSATLGKGFAECLYYFAECVRHSVNEASPVVYEGGMHLYTYSTAMRARVPCVCGHSLTHMSISVFD
jgi:hypothetical protein